MSIKEYLFEDGKYKIYRNINNSKIIDIQRNNIHWAEGYIVLNNAKIIHAMLNRIDELENYIDCAQYGKPTASE